MRYLLLPLSMFMVAVSFGTLAVADLDCALNVSIPYAVTMAVLTALNLWREVNIRDRGGAR